MPVNFYNFFRNAILKMNEWGFIEIVLPFILVYALVYSVLYKAELFKNVPSPNRIYVVIALVISLLFVSTHVIWGATPGDGILGVPGHPFYGYPDPVEIMNTAIPTLTIWLVVLLMFMIILGMAGSVFGDDSSITDFFNEHKGKVALGAMAVVIYTFGISARLWPNIRNIFRLYGQQYILEGQTAIFVIFLLAAGLAFYFISPKGSGDSDG